METKYEFHESGCVISRSYENGQAVDMNFVGLANIEFDSYPEDRIEMTESGKYVTFSEEDCPAFLYFPGNN